MTEISVVIPVYRSAHTLPELTLRLNRVLDPLGLDYEIIFVNDGSPDKSWEKIQEISRPDPRIIGLNLMRNYGQHAALAAGVCASRGSIIITMDDDLQTPPEEIPKLISKVNEGFDLVYGIRREEMHGPIRNICSRLGKKLLAQVLGVPVASSLSSYKAFRGCLKEQVVRHSGPVVFLDALLCWGTTKIGTAEVNHQKRLNGISGYNWRKLMLHYANMITSFSQLPLKIASFLGLLTMIFGLGLFLFVLVVYLIHGIPVPGFTFVAASVTLFSGIQLLILGIMGEYLARMHQSLIGMPAFVVREKVQAIIFKK